MAFSEHVNFIIFSPVANFNDQSIALLRTEYAAGMLRSVAPIKNSAYYGGNTELGTNDSLIKSRLKSQFQCPGIIL